MAVSLPIKIKLPDSFFDEEVRCGYTVTSDMKKIWAVELDLLCEFERVCREENIRYYLDSGTLLGAIRHGGFIPWDDDIDVSLLREDYDKLLKIGPKRFKHPYFFQCTYTENDYFRFHAQLRNSETTGILRNEAKRFHFNQGIFIDIFVMDGLTMDIGLRTEQIKELNYYRNLYRKMFKAYSNNPMRELAILCRARYLKQKYDIRDLFAKFETCEKRFEDSEYVDMVGFRTDPNRVRQFKRIWFSETETAGFEGFLFVIPKCYDEVLKTYYGDEYMTPRKVPTVHGEVIFNAEKPYTEVLHLL